MRHFVVPSALAVCLGFQLLGMAFPARAEPPVTVDLTYESGTFCGSTRITVSER